MQIRKANFDDCSSVAKLHKEYLNKSFLGTLGPDFLSLLYRSLVDFEKGILLVAESEGKVIGFVSGTIKTGEFYKYFIKRNYSGIVFVLLPRIFSIKIIKKIIETAKYSKKDLGISVPDAELLSMAVADGFQGKGIAKQLFEKFIAEFHNKSMNGFKIIAGNELVKANKFYRKMGCEKISEIEIHNGDTSTVYTFKNEMDI